MSLQRQCIGHPKLLFFLKMLDGVLVPQKGSDVDLAMLCQSQSSVQACRDSGGH